MRSVAVPVAAITALLVGVASAAPAPGNAYGEPPSYTSSTPAAPSGDSSADSPVTTPGTGTSPGGSGSDIIVVPTKTCGSSPTATASNAASPVSWTPTEKHQKACDDPNYTEATADDPLMPADWEACAALYSEFVTLNGTFNLATKSGGDSSAGSNSGSGSTAPTYGSGFTSGGSSSGTKSGSKPGSKPGSKTGSKSGTGSGYSPDGSTSGGSSSGTGSSAPTYGSGYNTRSYGYGSGASVTVGGKKISYTPILKSDSCVFGLASGATDKVLAVGDVDISLILKHALDQGSSGSMVGIRGSSKCPSRGENGVKGKVHFQMYYPGA